MTTATNTSNQTNFRLFVLFVLFVVSSTGVFAQTTNNVALTTTTTQVSVSKEATAVIATENGIATEEPTIQVMSADLNSKRVPFVSSYLSEMRKAIVLDKVNVTGYFYWSLFDNFEWSFGNDKRFGLVRVDYKTFERTTKPLARWFTKLMEHNRLPTEQEWEEETAKNK